MSAARYDITLEAGAPLEVPIQWKDSNGDPVDLTDYSAKAQIRYMPSSPDVLLELSTANGKITLDAATGTVTLLFSATDTAAMTWGSARYDLKVTAINNRPARLVEGIVTVSQQVTR